MNNTTKTCNGYGDACDPNAQYSWQFVACPGCAACRHLPRCNYCSCTARNGRGECLTHIAERKAFEEKQQADRRETAQHVVALALAAGEKFNCVSCGDGTITESCRQCCPHDERDHGICLYCGDEEDPGAAIDRAMDAMEDR